MVFLPSRMHEVGGRLIHIYDSIFEPEIVRSFATVVMQLSFRRRESFDRELSVAIENDKFRSAPFLWPVTEELFERVGRHEFGVTDPAVCLSHTYAAAMGPGSCGTVHRDKDSSDSITFLYYANLAWRGEWGGETVFYGPGLDAAVAVTPKPGRLVMFHSNILHRAGVPHPDTPTYRYTFSVFYYPRKDSADGEGPIGSSPSAEMTGSIRS